MEDHKARDAIESSVVGEKREVMLNAKRRNPQIVHLRHAKISGPPKHRCANIAVCSCGLYVGNERMPIADGAFDHCTAFIWSSAARRTVEKLADHRQGITTVSADSI
jgi:hypothetical protein